MQLTDEGRRETRQTAAALWRHHLRPRDHERSAARRRDGNDRRARPRARAWPDLREIEAGRLTDLSIPRAAFVHAFSGTLPEDDEVPRRRVDRLAARPRLPALQRLAGEPGWDVALVVAHGGTIRALLSYALTGGRAFLGNFELAPASFSILDVGDDWIVRAVNVTPYDLTHTRTRLRTMEELWAQYKSM